MGESSSGYLLGIGSNIDPQVNMASIIDLLLNHFSTLTLSRILKIPPVGMNSSHDFLNVVLFIATEMTEIELKTICNSIETRLGRDREDPTRKTKDRSADLDILTSVRFPQDAELAATSITDEYFLYPMLNELKAYLSDKPFESLPAGVEINLKDLTFGQAATTIHRNA